MADKRISQLAERVDIANNDVVAIVASGATVTNKATMSSIQAFMQGALDVGVTTVGVTISEIDTAPISVTGSPITTSGNITINLPRATNSIRGVLDAEDFIIFSNKQSTITLTTSGTSGDATFDGATLNIPNYAQDLSGFVTLGTNQAISGTKIFSQGALVLAAAGTADSTHLRNSAGDSTTVAGSNVLGFNSANNIFVSTVGKGGFVLGFNNSVSNRTYTLQDASGTLALTSDIPSITGLVTLDTVQTITAQKTITTSGGNDTLIVNHTSGSGIALDIAKAGNGEGLRVVKTSGTGNAVTITGGLLSAEAATLTGALNGTSAVFSGAVKATNYEFTGAIPASAASTGYIDYSGGGTRIFSVGTSGATKGTFTFIAKGADDSSSTPLTLASDGAATFSSSVTATSDMIRVLQTNNTTIAQFVADASNTTTLRCGLATFGSQAPDNLLGIVRANNSFLYKNGGALAVGTGGASSLILSTSDTERMRITSVGNVGIQNPSPQGILEVGVANNNTTYGGHFFSTFQIPINTWFTVFTVPNSNWAAITEFTFTSSGDYNRSGAAYMRWAYEAGANNIGVVYTLFNNSQNSTATFRYNGGNIQINITGGAVDYFVQVRIQGSKAQ